MKAFILSGCLMATLFVGSACAEVITAQCDEQGNIFNVYRNDLTIDLDNKTVQVTPYSNFKDINGRVKTWSNHKGDKTDLFDQTTYVIVQPNVVQWGADKPGNALSKSYMIAEKIMTDGMVKYLCH